MLGPKLFLLYVNDMPRDVRSSSIAMFANDMKCFKTIMFAADTELLQGPRSYFESGGGGGGGG